MYDFWTNRTCAATTDPTEACTIGTYPAYVLKATTTQDVQAGVNFARDNNVRLYVTRFCQREHVCKLTTEITGLSRTRATTSWADRLARVP